MAGSEMSFDWKLVVENVRANGGITLSLHGWPLMMGDRFDLPTWVVGGAVGPNGESVATRSMGAVEALTAQPVALMHNLYEARYGGFGKAMGLWVNPEGFVLLDLVDTFTSKSYAVETARLRRERAIFELVTKVLYFV